MFEQKRLGDNGTSAAPSKESGDRGDEMDEKDGQVAHLAIVPFSTSVIRLGYPQDLSDKSEIRHTQDGHCVTGDEVGQGFHCRMLASAAHLPASR